MERAQALQDLHGVSFPFSALASHIVLLSHIHDSLLGIDKAQALTDAFSARTLLIDQNILKQAGRNDSCPCGSGKKYKKCHGQA
jgi:uncharacterized protein YecA (UPF0149 family)